MEFLKQMWQGFTKTLVFVLLVAATGALVLFVRQAKNNTDKTLNNASKGQGTVVKDTKNTEKSAPKVESTDITTNWTPFSSVKGKFSLRYPKNWVQPVNRDACGPDIFERAVYLGPDSGSVLKCATEYFGQMAVYSLDGDKRSDSAFGKGYKDLTDKEVTINGLVGHRLSGVATLADPGAGFAPAEGTVEVRYVFYVPTGTTYVAKYIQAPPGNTPSTNVLNDFDLMITKTFKFAS